MLKGKVGSTMIIRGVVWGWGVQVSGNAEGRVGVQVSGNAAGRG